MSNRDAIMRLAVSSVICILIIANTLLGGIVRPNDGAVKAEKKSSAQSTLLNIPANGKIGVSESTSQTDKTVSSAESSQGGQSETAAVSAADGKVLGNIIEKFITPYTANTSYNNVYLKNSTGLEVDIKELLSSPLGFTVEKNGEPQVLILHTHTTESFMLTERDYYTENDASRTTDEQYNNVRLGKIVAERLNAAGIVTLHDTTTHDYPEYNGSYTRAAATIKSYLSKYPSIKIVIDMHRDAVTSGDSDKVKLVTEINGKKAAQIMLVMGSQSGSITNFPNWQENLKLAVRLQQTLEVNYPTLARSIYFCSRNYNESLTTGSMLIEIGTDANTIDEVSYSAELLADSLTELLNRLG